MPRLNPSVKSTKNTEPLDQYYLPSPPLPSPEKESFPSVTPSVNTPDDVRNIIYDSLGNSNIPMRIKSKFIESFGYVAGKYGWHVDSDGSAEFQNVNIGYKQITIAPGQDIQTAVNQVNSAGGGVVFLKNGTYNQATNITLPSNVILAGTNVLTTIIDFEGNNAGIVLQGSNVYTAGTVSVSVGSSTVTGAGTTWTSAMIGEYIWLAGGSYQISAVGGAGSLTVDVPFEGKYALSGSAYAIAVPVTGCFVHDITTQNSSGSLLTMNYTRLIEIYNFLMFSGNYGISGNFNDTVVFHNIYIDYCNYGMYYTQSIFGGLDNFIVSNILVGDGYNFNGCFNSTIINSQANACAGNGVTFNNCYLLSFISSSLFFNGGKGVELISNNTDCVFIDDAITNNTLDGVKIANSIRCIFTSNQIESNGGYGINVSDTISSGNLASGNTFINNVSGDIYDPSYLLIDTRITTNTGGIEIGTGGIKYLTSYFQAQVYGNSNYKYGNALRLYGDPVNAYFGSVMKNVPLYFNQGSLYADIHCVNRSVNPTGVAQTGDLAVVNAKLMICTASGTPGTWAVVGSQS